MNAFDRVDAQEGGQTFNHLGTLLALNPGDYVEVCVYQGDVAPLSIYSNGTFLEMHYVSPR